MNSYLTTRLCCILSVAMAVPYGGGLGFMGGLGGYGMGFGHPGLYGMGLGRYGIGSNMLSYLFTLLCCVLSVAMAVLYGGGLGLGAANPMYYGGMGLGGYGLGGYGMGYGGLGGYGMFFGYPRIYGMGFGGLGSFGLHPAMLGATSMGF